LYNSGDTVAVDTGVVSMTVGISVRGVPVMMGWTDEELSTLEEELPTLEERPVEAGPVEVAEPSRVDVADVLPEFDGTPMVEETGPDSLLDTDAGQADELLAPEVSEPDPVAADDSVERPELSPVAVDSWEDDGAIWSMGVTVGLSVADPKDRVMALWRDCEELCVELADDRLSEAAEVTESSVSVLVGVELSESVGVALSRPVDAKLSELMGFASAVELSAVDTVVVSESSNPVSDELGISEAARVSAWFSSPVSVKASAGSPPSTDENCRGALAARVHRRGPASAAAASDKAPYISVVIRILVLCGYGVLALRTEKNESKSSRFCGGPARKKKRVK
jgi:hypothetical protein